MTFFEKSKLRRQERRSPHIPVGAIFPFSLTNQRWKTKPSTSTKTKASSFSLSSLSHVISYHARIPNPNPLRHTSLASRFPFPYTPSLIPSFFQSPPLFFLLPLKTPPICANNPCFLLDYFWVFIHFPRFLPPPASGFNPVFWFTE